MGNHVETSQYFTNKNYSFFTSRAGKIERAQEFKTKIFE